MSSRGINCLVLSAAYWSSSAGSVVSRASLCSSWPGRTASWSCVANASPSPGHLSVWMSSSQLRSLTCVGSLDGDRTTRDPAYYLPSQLPPSPTAHEYLSVPLLLCLADEGWHARSVVDHQRNGVPRFRRADPRFDRACRRAGCHACVRSTRRVRCLPDLFTLVVIQSPTCHDRSSTG